MSQPSVSLKALSHDRQVAFAALCAQRVIPIFEIDCNSSGEALKLALKFCWQFVTGEGFDVSRMESIRQGVIAITPNIEVRGDELSAAMHACVSTVYALNSITDRTGKSVEDASRSAIEAVASFTDFTGEGEGTEIEWQRSVVSVLLSLESGFSLQDIPSIIRDSKPKWLERV